MPAYLIVDMEVLDPKGYEEYKNLAGPSVTKYGGRYLIRGGTTVVLEGEWTPKRLVVLEFPSLERARTWWNSPEYTEARRSRARTARARMVLVEGMA